MVFHIKLAALIAVPLLIFFPSLALAQGIHFSVSPAEVRIDNLLPGETTEFELTIRNGDDINRAFTLTTFHPPQKQRRAGRAEFPDDSWISFSSQEITVTAGAQTNVRVTLAIPQQPELAGKDWEIWLAVTAESPDLLGVRLYVRLLVSTKAQTQGKVNLGLVIGIAAAIILLGYAGYHYFRRRTEGR